MWNRTYLLVLTVCAVIMAALTYYSWSWLNSIGSPQAVVEGYLYHSRIAWKFVWISSIALLILANAVLAKSHKSWAMWTTFLYFALFVAIRSFGLERSFFQFKQTNGLTESSFTLAPLVGAVICIAGAAIVYANQFAVVRLQDKMYPANNAAETDAAEEIDEEVPKENPETKEST
jgi:hypothetical protein